MRRIRISRKRNRGVWGLAFQDQNRIELDPDLSEELLLEIAVHETVHIACPDLAEEAVDRIGKAAADVLWRLGFRRED
jgi:hypothetical protein